MKPSRQNATLIGLIAVLLWGALIGLLRSVTEILGPIGGAAVLYSVASLFLLIFIGVNRIRQLPRAYLIWGSLLFVTYELCLALSIGYANTSRQAIEVGMVNYLWPALTLIFAILFNHQKTNWLILPGFIIALTGIAWVLGGDQGLDWHSMLNNIQDNPLSYSLAFIGAILWATYCTVTVRLANGGNAITLFFMLTSLALWASYFIIGGEALIFTPSSLIYLVLAGASVGFSYAAWNIGILHGNVTILAGASYFIPVISAALAALILSTPLPLSFWQGAAMICIGSILCWWATRNSAGRHIRVRR